MTDSNEQPSSPSPSGELPNNITISTNDNLPPTTNAPHSSMAENAQTGNSHPAAESPNTTPGQLEATLQNVLDTMHNSDFFPRVAKDPQSRFWSAYERIATQHDNEFLEMHNGQMDVLLIFAGLFSAISSAFIVSMGSSLIPNPSDTTNALLMILINKVDNDTFPAQQAALPVWTGPSSTIVWIQTLAYMSLSSSLLAAFGAVLEKQWLGHFKTSRFGKGALHERCKRRQQKFDGLETWYFSAVISALPILLQLSLLFFGIALAADIWTQQHTVASVVMATTAFGVIFYFFTLVASLKSPDCPFQTPVSAMSQHALSVMATFGKGFREKWRGRPKSWADFRNDLRYFSGRALSRAKNLIMKPITPLVVYLSRHLGALRRHVRSLVHAEAGQYLEQSRATGSVRSGSAPDRLGDLEMRVLEASGGVQTGSSAGRGQSLNVDPEPAGGSEHSGITGDVQPGSSATGEQIMWLEELDLTFLEPHIEAQRAQDLASSNAVQWTLETTTDIDIIATAASMIPEIEWPNEDDVTNVLERLKGHFYACFQPTGHILVLAQGRAVVCLKAIYHICIKWQLPAPFYIFESGRIQPTDDERLYYMQPNHEFLVVSCAMGDPIELDITSLPTPDRMWMAHVFTYRLNGDGDDPKFTTFVINFVRTCIVSESPRLVADCLLLAGQLVGMRVDHSHLARLDKSKGIAMLGESVISCVLGVLLGDNSPGHGWQLRALKLLPSVLQHFVKGRIYFSDRCTNKKCIKYCFRLLEEASGTEAEDNVRSRTVASLIHHFQCSRWEPRNWYTQRKFDLLVDYHLQICEGMDYDIISHTFRMLSGLGGSPSTQDRMRRYIDTMVQFMGQKLLNVYPALVAACQARKDVALIGRDDPTFRKDFSMKLAVVLTDAIRPIPHDMNPFRNTSSLDWWRDIAYLYLLSTLSQDVTWQPHLRQSGHFDNCVVIADTMLCTRHNFWDAYAVPVAHIFANIDASGVHTPVWPLILRAWRHIFSLEFFGGWIEDARSHLPFHKDCLEALPIITTFARRRGDDKEEALITLVEQVCHKLDEEKQFCQQEEVQGGIQDQKSVGSPDICNLGKQIRGLLYFEGRV